jgi:hypothetical protein
MRQRPIKGSILMSERPARACIFRKRPIKGSFLKRATDRGFIPHAGDRSRVHSSSGPCTPPPAAPYHTHHTHHTHPLSMAGGGLWRAVGSGLRGGAGSPPPSGPRNHYNPIEIPRERGRLELAKLFQPPTRRLAASAGSAATTRPCLITAAFAH